MQNSALSTPLFRKRDVFDESQEPFYHRYLFLLCCTFFVYVLLLGHAPFHTPDEGRYATIAAHMWQSDDFVTPYLNGVRYFEKPPLVYWLLSIAYGCFQHFAHVHTDIITLSVGGLTFLRINIEFALRLVIVCFGLLGASVMWWWVRIFFGKERAFIAWLTLTSSFLYGFLSRMVILDMPFAALFASGLFIASTPLLKACAQQKRSEDSHSNELFFDASSVAPHHFIYSFLGGVCLGLACLAKSFVALFLAAAILGALALYVGLKGTISWQMIISHASWTAVVAIAIALPWHIIMALRHQDFIDFYVIREHFLRYLTTMHTRVQPWWFFAVCTILGMVPSVFLLLFPRVLKAISYQLLHNTAALFCGFWLMFLMVFFSCSCSLLVPYVLPILFPLAILLALGVPLPTYQKDRCLMYSENVYRGCYDIFWVILVLGVWVGFYRNIVSTAHAIMCTLIALAGLCWRCNLWIPHIILFSCLLWVTPWYMPRASVRKAVQTLQCGPSTLKMLKTAKIVSWGAYYQDLPIYLGRYVYIVSGKGELEFGAQDPKRDPFVNIKVIDDWLHLKEPVIIFTLAPSFQLLPVKWRQQMRCMTIKHFDRLVYVWVPRYMILSPYIEKLYLNNLTHRAER